MDRNEISISVIVPVYQVENYIDQCIQSILQQTYSNFQLVLIDDGSKDKSGNICDEYAKVDPRIKVIHKENGGLMSAWIKGVQESSNDFIVFVDSDDWVELDMLEQFVKCYSKTHAEIICCNFYAENKNNRYVDMHPIKEGIYDRAKIETEIYPFLINDGHYLSRVIRMCRWAKFIKRKLILDNLKYCNLEITVGEDLNIIFPIMLTTNSIYIMKDACLYHYRQNSMSIMNRFDKKMWNQVLILHNTLLDINDAFSIYDFKKQIEIDFFDLAVLCVEKELYSESSGMISANIIFNSPEWIKLIEGYNANQFKGIKKLISKAIVKKSYTMIGIAKLHVWLNYQIKIIKKGVTSYDN